MAGSSFFALIDDVATLLDDVAVLTKAAAGKTAGVLGDDLALNAEQVSGVQPDRELPVVWAVAKGSLRNKAILVPLALAISAAAPWLVQPLLMVGGTFLCFEGFEKLWHARGGHDAGSERGHAELVRVVSDPTVDLVAYEQAKVRGAVRTDFVLSAEIIAITLGAVAAATLATQLLVLVTVALGMTVGVYGVVAAIVKLDDAGVALQRTAGAGGWARARRAVGAAVLQAAPWMLKGLSIAGTFAMFLVGGGILVHGLPVVHHAIESAELAANGLPGVGGLLGLLTSFLLQAGFGVVSGGLVAVAVGILGKARQGKSHPSSTQGQPS